MASIELTLNTKVLDENFPRIDNNDLNRASLEGLEIRRITFARWRAFKETAELLDNLSTRWEKVNG